MSVRSPGHSFRLKSQPLWMLSVVIVVLLLLCGLAFCPHVSGENVLKIPVLCFVKTVKTELFENEDVTVSDKNVSLLLAFFSQNILSYGNLFSGKMFKLAISSLFS